MENAHVTSISSPRPQTERTRFAFLSPLAAVLRQWDRFWFTPADPLPLSILRLLIGGMLFYSHLVWGLKLDEFFSSTGWNSPELIAAVGERSIIPSFWWYVPDSNLLTVHWICSGLLVAFILGLGGRFTALAAWVIAVSYANRSSLANFGLDQILCIATLYLAIGPTTNHLSLDRWIHRRVFKKVDWGNAPSILANVAMRLVQIHLCVIYLWAGLGKLQGEAWWNGGAMWLALANYEYQSMDMTWFANYPRLLEFLTHLTIAWELAFAFLVWPKATRWLMLGLGIGMHFGIGAFLGMWTFGLVMTFTYIAFASPTFLHRVLNGFRGRSLASTAATLNSPLRITCDDEGDRTPVRASRSNAYVHSGLDAMPDEIALVLITKSRTCVQQFFRANPACENRSLVVSSLNEAKKLMELMPEAFFLRLDIQPVKNSSTSKFVLVRVVSNPSQLDSSENPRREVIPR